MIEVIDLRDLPADGADESLVAAELGKIVQGTGADKLMRPFDGPYKSRGDHMKRTGIVIALALRACGVDIRRAAEHGATAYVHDAGSLLTPRLRELTLSRDIWTEAVRTEFRIGHTSGGADMARQSLEENHPITSWMLFVMQKHHEPPEELSRMADPDDHLVGSTLSTALVDKIDATTYPRFYDVADKETRSRAIGLRTFGQAVDMFRPDFRGIKTFCGVPKSRLLGAIEGAYQNPNLSNYVNHLPIPSVAGQPV